MVPKAHFTGHRPHKLGGYQENPLRIAVRKWIESTIQSLLEHAPFHFIAGGALGVDTDGASLALQLGAPLHLYLPFENMGSYWPSARDREILEEHKKMAASVRTFPDKSLDKSFVLRDWAMVDDSILTIAVYDGTPGGTQITVDYAAEQGRLIWMWDLNRSQNRYFQGHNEITASEFEARLHQLLRADPY